MAEAWKPRTAGEDYARLIERARSAFDVITSASYYEIAFKEALTHDRAAIEATEVLAASLKARMPHLTGGAWKE